MDNILSIDSILESLSKLLTNRQTCQQNVYQILNEYLDQISTAIEQTMPGEYTILMSELKLLHNVPNLSKPFTLDGCNLFSQCLQSINNAVNAISDIVFNDYIFRQSSHQLSYTSSGGGYLTRKNAKESITNYDYQTSIIDNEILDILTTFAVNTIHYNIIEKFAMNSEPNDFTILLVKKCLTLELPIVTKKNLQDKIELQKDFVLESPIVTPNGINYEALMLRCGLIPSTPMLTADQLAKHFNQNKTASLFTTLQKNYNILYLHLHVGTPAAFEIDCVINKDYCEKSKLIFPPLYGLNKKILRRYNTIVIPEPLENNTILLDIPQKNTILHCKKSTDWFVIQSIAPGYYQILSTNASNTTLASQKINQEKILPLLGSFTARAQQYHFLQEETILANCINTNFKQQIDNYASITTVYPLADTLIINMSNAYVEYIMSVISKIKNIHCMIEFATDFDSIYQIIVTSMNLFPVYQEKQNQNYDTIILTRAYKFDQIVHHFIKQLHRQWAVDNTSAAIFNESNSVDLQNTIIQTTKNIFLQSCKELNKSHLWTEFLTSIIENFIN